MFSPVLPISNLSCLGLCRLSGVPDLPEARGKLCAAYDPSGAIIGNADHQLYSIFYSYQVD